ncbi:mitochondrial potassium channel-like [Gigantopelta aegis]|uniref:mitochondrial potassium channel-like n=1 Tax=Gigantopelta aegis TaxID=1735272 RepID=UPI001B888346|nr:mitochondrial potassium channel-like [Gigantopelta aegis]
MLWISSTWIDNTTEQEAEKRFLAKQEERRQKQNLLATVQARLKSVTADLDKTTKSQDRYLDLVKVEHSIIREEHQLLEDIRNIENQEREYFSFLSAAVRESHEKERTHAERTKYWSVIGSIVGAAIGITGTTINNYVRMKELRGIVDTSASTSKEMKSLTLELCTAVKSQFSKMEIFLNDLRLSISQQSASPKEKIRLPPSDFVSGRDLHLQTEKILEGIHKQEAFLDEEIRDIKKLLGLQKAQKSEVNVVYVGPDMQDMLQKTEDNLEWKIKMNALASATLVYGALALTIPLIMSFFSKGGS